MCIIIKQRWLTKQHISARKTAPTTQPMMTPAISADDSLLLLVVVLLSVLSVLSTETGTVAFTSPAPTFPAKSWYVPASK